MALLKKYIYKKVVKYLRIYSSHRRIVQSMSNVESVSKFVIHELRKLERDLLEERESGVGGVSVEHQIMMLVDHEEVF